MLAEWFESLITPCPPGARRLGYLHESIAINARARRQRDAWAAHLERSRAFLRRSAEAAEQHRCAWVLGSGGLHDVPLDTLAGLFDNVFLVDIVHPLRARRIVKPLINVHIYTCDLSAMAQAVLAYKPQSHNPLPKPTQPDCQLPEPDWVASVNMLAQLPLTPASYLRTCGCPEAQVETWMERLLLAHWQWLQRLPGERCLITEHLRTFYNQHTHEQNVYEPLRTLALPEPTERWTWKLAPSGEIDRHSSLTLEIAAYDNSIFH